jgi:hypothetical protein
MIMNRFRTPLFVKIAAAIVDKQLAMAKLSELAALVLNKPEEAVTAEEVEAVHKALPRVIQELWENDGIWAKAVNDYAWAPSNNRGEGLDGKRPEDPEQARKCLQPGRKTAGIMIVKGDDDPLGQRAVEVRINRTVTTVNNAVAWLRVAVDRKLIAPERLPAMTARFRLQ